MRKISTTKLAKRIGMESLELFRVLCENRWMYKKEDKWHLTKEGRMVGGEIAYNPKFGEFIVWPEDLDIKEKVEYENTIKATEIGEYFSISAQKVNLQLSELGWIRKDFGGWVSTKAGEKNEAIQMEAMNGKPYVVWDKSILNNKHLIREIKSSKGENDSEFEIEYNEKTVTKEYEDFRLKFPASLRAPDGHYVRSRAEILIDDFLYKNGIVHAYERKLNVDEVVYCDFYIPSQNLYIEYWGLEDEKYLARKKTKLEVYARYGFNLIELNDSDIENLDEKFAAKLRKFKINVN